MQVEKARFIAALPNFRELATRAVAVADAPRRAAVAVVRSVEARNAPLMSTFGALQAPSSPVTAFGYRTFASPLVVRGAGDTNAIAPNDIAQGALGDCWLLSGMASLARANPAAVRHLIPRPAHTPMM